MAHDVDEGGPRRVVLLLIEVSPPLLLGTTEGGGGGWVEGGTVGQRRGADEEPEEMAQVSRGEGMDGPGSAAPGGGGRSMVLGAERGTHPRRRQSETGRGGMVEGASSLSRRLTLLSKGMAETAMAKGGVSGGGRRAGWRSISSHGRRWAARQGWVCAARGGECRSGFGLGRGDGAGRGSGGGLRRRRGVRAPLLVIQP
jgi:hypothetical protein